MISLSQIRAENEEKRYKIAGELVRRIESSPSQVHIKDILKTDYLCFNSAELRALVIEALDLHQSEQAIIDYFLGRLKETNNLRQAKVDGKEDWNDALEQSACKFDALLQELSEEPK